MAAANHNTGTGVFLVIICVLAFYVASTPDVSVTSGRLRSQLLDHFSKNRHHDNEAQKAEARDYIRDFFTQLDTGKKHIIRIQNFTTPPLMDDEQVDGANIIYIIPGSRWGTCNDKITLLGAHYDTQKFTPGVDDNGSGMAALLECASLVASLVKNPLNSVIFVAFDIEETGLIGSDIFLEEYFVPDVLEAYKISPDTFQGAINLDTIMNYDSTPGSQGIPHEVYLAMLFPELYKAYISNEKRGDYLLAIGRRDEESMASDLLSEWNDPAAAWHMMLPLTGRPTQALASSPEVLGVVRDLFRSDHHSFWQYDSGNYTDKGLKAVFLTDTGDFRGIMQQCYHQPCDNTTTMITDTNLQFLANTTHALYRYLHRKAMDKSPSIDASCVSTDIETSGSNRPVSDVIIICALWLGALRWTSQG